MCELCRMLQEMEEYARLCEEEEKRKKDEQAKKKQAV